VGARRNAKRSRKILCTRIITQAKASECTARCFTLGPHSLKNSAMFARICCRDYRVPGAHLRTSTRSMMHGACRLSSDTRLLRRRRWRGSMQPRACDPRCWLRRSCTGPEYGRSWLATALYTAPGTDRGTALCTRRSGHAYKSMLRTVHARWDMDRIIHSHVTVHAGEVQENTMEPNGTYI